MRAITPSEKVRVGIVGAGLMGRWHAHACGKAGGILVAVADRNELAAARLARRVRGVEIFGSADELLRRADVDILHVCTPGNTHHDIAMTAIARGVHLLVEKPLTPTVAESEDLLQAASKQEVMVCPVHQFVFQNGFLSALRLLPAIAPVIHIESVVCSAGGEGMESETVDELICDILPHPLSLFHELCPAGFPEDGWFVQRPRIGELRAYCQSDETTFSIIVTMNARPTQCMLSVFGEAGTLHLDLFHGYAFRQRGAVSRAQKIVGPFDRSARRFSAAAFNLARRLVNNEPAYPGLGTLVARFYEAASSSKRPPLTAAHALSVARVRQQLVDHYWRASGKASRRSERQVEH